MSFALFCDLYRHTKEIDIKKTNSLRISSKNFN